MGGRPGRPGSPWEADDLVATARARAQVALAPARTASSAHACPTPHGRPGRHNHLCEGNSPKCLLHLALCMCGRSGRKERGCFDGSGRRGAGGGRGGKVVAADHVTLQRRRPRRPGGRPGRPGSHTGTAPSICLCPQPSICVTAVIGRGEGASAAVAEEEQKAVVAALAEVTRPGVTGSCGRPCRHSCLCSGTVGAQGGGTAPIPEP